MSQQRVGAVFEIKDNFTAKARSISGAVKNLEGDMKGATKSVGSYRDAQGRLRDANGKFIKDTEKATESVKGFGKGLSGAASRGIDSIKGKIAGLAAAYVSLQGISKITTDAISEASSLEQYRNTLNVVMKDTKKAAEMMQWANEFALKTPFETKDVVEGTVRLQSYGISAKETMTQIGDMAAVMNKPLEQAIEAIGDAQTGELERLKEFSITKQQIVDKANKIFKGKEVVNKKGQITDQKKFNQAMFALMNDRFKGGMEAQNNTLKGAISNIKGTYKSVLASMMGVDSSGNIQKGGVFDTIKGKALSLAKTLEKWQKDGTIKKWGQDAKDMWKEVEPVFSSAWGVIKSLAGVVKELGPTFKAMFGIVKPILDGIAWGLDRIAEGIKALPNLKGFNSQFRGPTDLGTLKQYYDGSHANGLNRVPFDGYKAILHKDETVLTKNQADRYRKGDVNTKTSNNVFNINVNGSNKSTDEIINEFVPKLKLALSNM